MRTLHVITSLGPGGAERSLVELLLDARSRHGWTSEVVVLDPGPGPLRAELEDHGIGVRPLAGTTRRRRARELRTLVDDVAPDLVHSTLLEANLLARAASAGPGRPPLLTSYVNASYGPEVRAVDTSASGRRRRVVHAVDATTIRFGTTHVHAISQVVAHAVRRDLRWPAARTTVITRGRDRTRLGRADPERRTRVRARLGLGGEVPVVAAIGRVEHQKGLTTLVAALPRLLDAHPDLVVLHAGRPGAATAELEQEVRRLGLTDHVRLLGVRDDVPDLLVAADALAFPSRWEGLGGVLVEALALETPVVASDLAVVREVCGTDAAVLVPTTHPDAWAAALHRVLTEPGLRHDLRRAGTRRFEAHHQLVDTTDAFVTLGRSLSAGGPATGGRPPASGR